MSSIVTITEPTSMALTVKEAKDHLRVPGNADDVYIAGLVDTAIKNVEHRTGFKLMSQTVEMRINGFPNKKTLSLETGKVTSVTSVKYDDTDDTEQTWAATNYWEDVISKEASITHKDTVWPNTERGKPSSVRIRFVAGWTDHHDVPAHFKTAIKLLVGSWYNNREEVITGTIVTTLPVGVDAILTGNLEYMIYVL